MGLLDDVGRNFLGGGGIGTEQVVEGAATGLGYIGQFVWMMTGVAVVGFVFYVMYLFNIEVIIKTYEAGQLKNYKKDRARLKTDKQGKEKLVLLKSRKTTPKPQNKYRYRKGKKEVYEFMEDDNGELHPIPPPNVRHIGEETRRDVKRIQSSGMDRVKEIIGLKKPKYTEVKKDVSDFDISNYYIPQDRRYWYIAEGKSLEEKIKQKDRLKELLKQMMFPAAMLFIFLTAFFVFKNIENSASSLASAINAMAEACLGRV